MPGLRDCKRKGCGCGSLSFDRRGAHPSVHICLTVRNESCAFSHFCNDRPAVTPSEGTYQENDVEAYGWFNEIRDEARDSFEFKLAALKIEVTERILEAMERRSMNRKQLADSLGVSKASVSRLLNNGSNATLKTLLQIAESLDCDLSIGIRSRAATRDFGKTEEEDPEKMRKAAMR